MLERAAQDATVLLVEQNLGVVRRLAQQIVILDHGEVVHVGGAADLNDEKFVRRLLGVAGAV